MRYFSWPFPPGAHDVQYATRAGGLQNCESYVRLEAPVEECYALAAAIFADEAKHLPHYTFPTFQPVSHPPREKGGGLPIGWFDNDHIAKGAVAGEGWGWQSQIWIDDERGVFYYKVTD